MNRAQTIETITSDSVLMAKWRQLVSSGEMKDMLMLANCYRGDFSKSKKPSELPHIRQEENGGMRAWDKLEYLLDSLPFKENKAFKADDDDGFTGYVKDHMAERTQEEFNDKINNV
tara:strand:- start:4243 stop:4590 length:348 start_codon:yes stop_codon:yes gene_type:complete